MNIPKEFNGFVSFFIHTLSGSVRALDHKEEKCWADYGDCGYTRVSDPIQINCALYDVLEKQIEVLEKQIEKERANSQFRINQMLGRIQELQALEVKS